MRAAGPSPRSSLEPKKRRRRNNGFPVRSLHQIARLLILTKPGIGWGCVTNQQFARYRSASTSMFVTLVKVGIQSVAAPRSNARNEPPARGLLLRHLLNDPPNC